MVDATADPRTWFAEPLPEAGRPLTPAEYLARGLTTAGVHEGVAERARAEVATLGTRPASVVAAVAEEARTIVGAEADGRLVPTRFGVMTLHGYLGTRAFELTVHGLDVVRAAGLAVPALPAGYTLLS